MINGLTDKSHPCQVMADIMTFEEHTGPIKGHTIAWVGDGNNVAVSWIHAAVRFGFELRIACPDALRPGRPVLDWVKRERVRCSIGNDAAQAVRGADCVVTDTWVSMGQTDGRAPREDARAVQRRWQAHAPGHARRHLHALPPAYRGREVTADVIDGPQSVVLTRPRTGCMCKRHPRLVPGAQ